MGKENAISLMPDAGFMMQDAGCKDAISLNFVET